MKEKMTTNTFASKLHVTLNGENLFYSPFSIQMALGMCLAGAKEETADCLAKLLECPTNQIEQKQFFTELAKDGQTTNESYELCSANALWSQKGMKFSPEYPETIQNIYNGKFTELNYKNKTQAVETINNWCNDKTKGKIPIIIDETFINNDTLLILTNAIYFKGKWKKQFKKTSTADKNFTNANGEIKKVPTMHIRDDLLYGSTQQFKSLELPYQGDDLSMLIVLPNDPTTILDKDLEKTYNEAINCLSHTEVNVALPKFKIETQYKLGSKFKEMGAALAFSDNANFSGITKEKLKISEVIHKAFVECDEEGTEAAAATAVGMMRCASVRVTPSFYADHPFLFFIKNNKSKNILFCGRINQL